MLRETGWTVLPFDLFPFRFKVEGLECQKADITEGLPLDDSCADLVVCEEGIEHVSDQIALLREFNRVLRKGGLLIVTTPNISCLRSRLSSFLYQSEYMRRLPPSEFDAVWFAEGSAKTYYGHLFLIGHHRLAALAGIAGFEVVTAHPNKVNWPSVLLGISWPLLALLNLDAAFFEALRRRKLGFGKMWRVYWALARQNLSPTVLFCKHTVIEFRKVADPSDIMSTSHQKFQSAMESSREPGPGK
jgi:SAM-dependent methyltransferase